MKIRVLLFAAVLVFEYAANAQKLHPPPVNRLPLEIEKTGLLRGKTHVIEFGKYRGILDYNDQKPEFSKVGFEIESNSIVCLDTWVSEEDKDKLLRKVLDEMLAADKVSLIGFVSNRVTAK